VSRRLAVAAVVLVLAFPVAALAWGRWYRGPEVANYSPVPVAVTPAVPVFTPAPVMAPVPLAPVSVAPVLVAPPPAPACPPLAVPGVAPPSGVQEPPLAGPPPPPASGQTGHAAGVAVAEHVANSGPAVAESPLYDVYPVASANRPRPAGDRVAVTFRNLSGRDVALAVDGQTRSLPNGRWLRLELGRTFAWEVDGRGTQTERLPAGEAGVEVVLRR
jgi:hypothetical protein